MGAAHDKVWNVAFYGAGDRAQPYLRALARRSDVQLAATCDLDDRAAEQTAAGWGARVFLSYAAMLEEVRPDALWICVEPHLQGDVILKAVEMDIPFFVEPPGAVDYERARLYGRRAAEKGLVAAVGFAARYTDVVQEAREYLGTNPVALALAWWLCRPEGAPPPTAAEMLWSNGCRLVDTLRLFCGEVLRVRALSAGAAGGGLIVQLEFASGTVGMFTCATFARAEPRIELELLGDGWSFVFGEGQSSLRLAERDKITIIRCQNVPAADHAAAFLEAITAKRPEAVAAGYADALRTLAVCHAAALSAREGRPVAVDEGLTQANAECRMQNAE
jgi:predicted dehydrogenase